MKYRPGFVYMIQCLSLSERGVRTRRSNSTFIRLNGKSYINDARTHTRTHAHTHTRLRAFSLYILMIFLPRFWPAGSLASVSEAVCTSIARDELITAGASTTAGMISRAMSLSCNCDKAPAVLAAD
jgi:hypothetical protein